MTISRNNMLLKSYRFWVNTYRDPADVCEFINNYVTAVLFKMLPVLILVPTVIISMIYSLAVMYNFGVPEQTNDVFLIIGLTSIWVTVLFACIGIAFIAWAFIFEAMARVYNISTQPDSIKLLTSSISAKINKFCMRINYKD